MGMRRWTSGNGSELHRVSLCIHDYFSTCEGKALQNYVLSGHKMSFALLLKVGASVASKFCQRCTVEAVAVLFYVLI